MASKKRVLLLKSLKEDAAQDSYQELFAESGMDAAYISPLAFEFINLETLYSHIQHPDHFSALVFTSPRTVQAVHECVCLFSSTEEWNEGLLKTWEALPSYTVGTTTASAARDLGMKTKGEDAGNATNLVHIVKHGIAPGSKPLLIPRGEMAREELTKGLSKAGIAYQADTVYKTICSPTLKEDLERYFETAVPDVIVFFSPSGVNFTADTLKRLKPEHTKFVSIGPTTASAMEEQGYKVAATSAKPDPKSLLNTILDLMDVVS